MSENVVQIGDYAFKRKANSWLQERGKCGHTRMTYDDNGEVVTCDDCGKQISAFWALVTMADAWRKMEHKLTTKAAKAEQDRVAVLHLSAAIRVEKAWRSRTMVPSCPHCNRGIFPQDNFGSSMVHKAIENKRREAKP